MPLQPPDLTPMRRIRSAFPLSARSLCKCARACSDMDIAGAAAGGAATAPAACTDRCHSAFSTSPHDLCMWLRPAPGKPGGGGGGCGSHEARSLHVVRPFQSAWLRRGHRSRHNAAAGHCAAWQACSRTRAGCGHKLANGRTRLGASLQAAEELRASPHTAIVGSSSWRDF